MAPILALVDDFSTQDATKWAYPGSGAVATGGQLVITSSTSYPAITSSVQYDLTGSSITIQMVHAANTGTTGTIESYLILFGDDPNLNSIGLNAAAGTFEAFVRTGGSKTSLQTATYSAVNHQWLRIRETGGTVFCEVSADRVTWNAFGSTTTPVWATAAAVHLGSGYGGVEADPGTAVFDNVNLSVAARAAVDLTHVGSSTWVAPASSATVSPTYPASIQTGDCIYAVLHVKPDTATVATPTNWALVGAASGGSGTQGAGTGATKMHVYRRIASAAHAGTEPFTITGGSSPIGFMRAYRATGANLLFEAETLTSWSVGTASTTIGGTAGASLDLAAKDDVNAIIGTSDDQSTVLTLSGLSATGATFGTLTNDPTGTTVNAQGNDISGAAYRVPITAGTSQSPPVATATANSSETAMGLLFRVRATADIPPPPPPRVVNQAAIVRSNCW